jgi:hypothetical protein
MGELFAVPPLLLILVFVWWWWMGGDTGRGGYLLLLLLLLRAWDYRSVCVDKMDEGTNKPCKSSQSSKSGLGTHPDVGGDERLFGHDQPRDEEDDL